MYVAVGSGRGSEGMGGRGRWGGQGKVVRGLQHHLRAAGSALMLLVSAKRKVDAV